MDNRQLYKILSGDKEVSKFNFVGVFAEDTITLSALDFPCCMIINTKPHTHQGEHWIAVFKTEHNIGIYFDSYGYPPTGSTNIAKVLDSCDEWIHNDVGLQSPYSTVCGQYCVFFLTHMARGYSLEKIAYLLNDSGDKHANDANIFNYVLHKYSKTSNDLSELEIVDFPFVFSQISTGLSEQ